MAGSWPLYSKMDIKITEFEHLERLNASQDERRHTEAVPVRCTRGSIGVR